MSRIVLPQIEQSPFLYAQPVAWSTSETNGAPNAGRTMAIFRLILRAWLLAIFAFVLVWLYKKHEVTIPY